MLTEQRRTTSTPDDLAAAHVTGRACGRQAHRHNVAMGHIADRGARVGELARTLFLTLAGQILFVPSRRERGAVKAAAVVGAADGRWQLR